MYSCSDETNNSAQQNLALDSRSQESCVPSGENCEDAIIETESFGFLACPSGVTVRMNVTTCNGEINYEEVDVTPEDANCDLTIEQIEEAYRIFIRLHIRDNDDINNCNSSTTFLSNYIKKSCVQRCQGIGPVGGPFPIIFLPCSSGATGCCIERTRWCRANGDLIEIVEDAINIQGNCSSSQTTPCTGIGVGVCIPDRCRF